MLNLSPRKFYFVTWEQGQKKTPCCGMIMDTHTKIWSDNCTIACFKVSALLLTHFGAVRINYLFGTPGPNYRSANITLPKRVCPCGSKLLAPWYIMQYATYTCSTQHQYFRPPHLLLRAWSLGGVQREPCCFYFPHRPDIEYRARSAGQHGRYSCRTCLVTRRGHQKCFFSLIFLHAKSWKYAIYENKRLL
jgi:hypothetical protein